MWCGDDGLGGPAGAPHERSGGPERTTCGQAPSARRSGAASLTHNDRGAGGLYYLLPLDHITNVPLTLVGGLLILLAVTVWQRAIIRARYPALRAVEALATTVPLFLLLFASAYFTMATTSPANFSTLPHPHRCALPHRHHIQHRGVRDITAVSQSARLVVTAQKLVRH